MPIVLCKNAFIIVCVYVCMHVCVHVCIYVTKDGNALS